MLLLPTIASDAYLGAIAAPEDQMRTVNEDLTALKNLKASMDKKKPKKEKSSPRPLTSKPSKPKPLSHRRTERNRERKQASPKMISSPLIRRRGSNNCLGSMVMMFQ